VSAGSNGNETNGPVPANGSVPANGNVPANGSEPANGSGPASGAAPETDPGQGLGTGERATPQRELRPAGTMQGPARFMGGMSTEKALVF
jgi:hypothetical protein